MVFLRTENNISNDYPCRTRQMIPFRTTSCHSDQRTGSVIILASFRFSSQTCTEVSQMSARSDSTMLIQYVGIDPVVLSYLLVDISHVRGLHLMIPDMPCAGQTEAIAIGGATSWFELQKKSSLRYLDSSPLFSTVGRYRILSGSWCPCFSHQLWGNLEEICDQAWDGCFHDGCQIVIQIQHQAITSRETNKESIILW